jgi:hypothetical protein
MSAMTQSDIGVHLPLSFQSPSANNQAFRTLMRLRYAQFEIAAATDGFQLSVLDQILCVDSSRLVSEVEIPLISRMRCRA